MKAPSIKPVRCAIYTRVSTEHGLDQEFNSLDAQYDAASAYIKSQAHAGWTLIRSRYDDGGYSGGSTDRPDLQRLLDDIRARKIDVIVVYKVDRLTRSLADFAKLVELFDAHGVSFVSVTQQFNTTTSMGRGASPVQLRVQARPPGTESLDAETKRQKSSFKRANARRDQNPGTEWPEIPAETRYSASCRKRAVCGDCMVVCAVVCEPVSAAIPHWKPRQSAVFRFL